MIKFPKDLKKEDKEELEKLQHQIFATSVKIGQITAVRETYEAIVETHKKAIKMVKGNQVEQNQILNSLRFEYDKKIKSIKESQK